MAMPGTRMVLSKKRDVLKNQIFEKAGIYYERFSIVDSGERARIIALIEKSLKS